MKEYISSVTGFLRHPTQKVLLLVGKIDTEFQQAIIQQIMQEKLLPIYVDLSQQDDNEVFIKDQPIDRSTVLILTNGRLENYYAKYQLERWQVRVIVSCDKSWLHPGLDPSIYFAPIKGKKIQKHLLSTIELSLRFKVKPNRVEVKPTRIETPKIKLTESANLNTHFLNQKLMTRDAAIMRMLADRVMIDADYKASLFSLVFASRRNDHRKIAAANAITALNYARVPLSELDLSGINIAQANLSDAILDETILDEANLAGVVFKNAFLRNTSFIKANLTDVDFGEQYYDIQPIQAIGSLVTKRIEQEVDDLSYSNNMQFLGAIAKGKIHIINVAYKRIFKEIEASGCNRIALSPEGAIIAAGGNNNNIVLFNLKTGKQFKTLFGHSAPVSTLKFSSNGKMLSSGAGSTDDLLPLHLQNIFSTGAGGFNLTTDTQVRLWDVETATCKILKGHNRDITCVGFSLNNNLLASGSFDKAVRIWDTNTGKCLYELSDSTAPVTALVFASDKLLIVGLANGALQVWDITAGICLHVLTKHTFAVTSIAFSPDSALMASGSEDNSIYLWKLEDYSYVGSLSGYGQISPLDSKLGINALCFLFDNPKLINTEKAGQKMLLAVASKGNRTVRLAAIDDLLLANPDYIGEKANNVLKLMQFNEEDNHIFTCDHANTITQWDVKTGRRIKHFALPDSEVLMFIDNAKWLAVITHAKELQLIDINTLEIKAALKLENKAYSSLSNLIIKEVAWPKSLINNHAISNRGKYLALAINEDIYLYKIDYPDKIIKFKGHTDKIIQLTFSKDESLIASSSFDNTIRLWDIASQTCKNIFNIKDFGIRDAATCISISHDGALLAICNEQSILIIETQSGIVKSHLKDHSSFVGHVCFSPDNKLLASADLNNIRFWDISSARCLEIQSCYRSPAKDMHFSKDGQYFAVISLHMLAMWKITPSTFNYANVSLSYLTTRLMWKNNSELVLDQINFYNAYGLSEADIDLLANRQGTDKASLLGALNSGNLASVIWFMHKYNYKPGDTIMHQDHNSTEMTALMLAVISGSLPLVKFLINQGCSINANTPSTKYTPLISAIMQRQSLVAAYLIQAGAALAHQDVQGYTALHWAIDRKNKDIIKMLIAKNAPLDVLAKNGATPLKLAVFVDDIEILDILLSSITSLETKLTIINDLIQFAVSQRLYNIAIWLKVEYKTIHSVLLEQAQITPTDNTLTVIMRSLIKDEFPQAISLIKETVSADLALTDQEGNTALHWAVKKNNLSAVKALVVKAPEFITKANKHGMTPFLLAYGLKEQGFAVLKYLMENISDSEQYEQQLNILCKKEPYLYPAFMQYLHLSLGLLSELSVGAKSDLIKVQQLVEAGASIRLRELNFGCTPLILAAGGGHLAIVQWLIAKGASPGEKNKYGSTALHAAAQQGQLTVIQWLLNNNYCRFTEENGEGFTPLTVALGSKQYATAEWLIDYAKVNNTYLENSQCSQAKYLVWLVKGGKHGLILSYLTKFKPEPVIKEKAIQMVLEEGDYLAFETLSSLQFSNEIYHNEASATINPGAYSPYGMWNPVVSSQDSSSEVPDKAASPDEEEEDDELKLALKLILMAPGKANKP